MNEHTSSIAVDGAGFAIGDIAALESLFAQPVSPPPSDPREASLTTAYRRFGHLKADLDPLGRASRPAPPDLDPLAHGFDSVAVAERLATRLEAAYCGAIGWEFEHVTDPVARAWLASEAEAVHGRELAPEAATAAAIVLARAHAFEVALSRRIPGGKLFGLGGAEAFVLLLETILEESTAAGATEVVIGGMHRGRFNMLANVAQKPLGDLVAEILGKPSVPDGLGVSSDVSYHLGYSGDRSVAGRPLHVSISPHPSHLQLVPVIAQGRARAKQSALGPDGRRRVLPLLLHTDASFSGQGLVAEMLQLSGLPAFDLGGTIHVVIDNQVGFTTDPGEGRSARRPTDIARLIEAPVLHVNGDDADAVAHVARVAARYRARFGRDVLVDFVCYRRFGHNELDEPRFTQPMMYRAIGARPPVHEIFKTTLQARGVDVAHAVETAAQGTEDAMRAAFASAKAYRVNHADCFDGAWRGLHTGSVADMLDRVPTGVERDRLRAIGRLLTNPPDGFALDPKIARFLDERWQSIESGEGLNWATAEALALATLLDEGTPVRFGGQDSVRGAFTQRHLAIHDQTTGARHLVLSAVMCDPQAAEIHNTPLIEHAVLCYEYGVSLADPRRLVMWEAQFGEFLNIAQPVFDQCIACGEDRWLRSSGLVILLPHGLDGGGPDHSTGRPERLLAAAAGANIQVVNASTPANFFHVLRRQIHRPFRKPLVVLTPKALLRHKACVSPLDDFGAGSGFRAVLADDAVPGASRVVLCTGKIFYDLAAAVREHGLDGRVAFVRIEQLHPLPEAEIAAVLARYPAADIVWCEEEPENMGYFTHLDRRLEAVAGRRVRRIGRPAVATPATGVKYWHEAEARQIVDAALDGL